MVEFVPRLQLESFQKENFSLCASYVVYIFVLQFRICFQFTYMVETHLT